MRIVADIETFSALDLKAVGSALYAAHPSTDVHFLCFAVDDGAVQTWRPGEPVPGTFGDAAEVWWHNTGFDPHIYQHVLTARHGFPPLPLDRQRCTMRLALAHSFPAELGKLCEALGLPYAKDPEARRAMLRLIKPASPGENPERRARDLDLLHQRCVTDVLSTRAVLDSPRLAPLGPAEREIFLLDAKINAAGVRVNMPFLTGACTIAAAELEAVNARLAELTAGEIASVHQVEKIRAAINAQGHNLKSLSKRSVASALGRDPDEYSRALMQARQAGAHNSAAKFEALATHASAEDHRVRDAFRIYGAGPGRWSSPGANLHNLPRNDAEVSPALVEVIARGDREELAKRGAPLEIIKNLSRAALCAAPGCELICVDFGMIESRVTAWLGGEQWKLDLFRRYDSSGNADIEPYRVLACAMLHKSCPPGALTKAERHLGKCGELAFGFGGSTGAWSKIVDDGRSEAEIKSYVTAWRAKHQKVVRYWYALAQAARTAICVPGRPVKAEPSAVTALFDGTDLRLTLPSGRGINYPDAELVPSEKFPDMPSNVGFNDNAKGKWSRAAAWYGQLTENVVQGCARDLLRDAMLRFDAKGWRIVAHCHDEIVIEAPIGAVDPKAVLACLLEAPEWAAGLPLAGSCHVGPLYLEGATAAPAAAKNYVPILDGFTPSPRKPKKKPAPAPEIVPIAAAAPQPATADPFADLIGLSIFPPPGEAPRYTNGGNGHAENGGTYPHGEHVSGEASAPYIYPHVNGAPVLKVVKYVDGGKKSYPTYFHENGRWVKGALKGKMAERAIPYRLPELVAAPPGSTVLICEGEKDVKTAVKLGFIATCNPGGAGKWRSSFSRWLTGFATAYVLEDNDAPGRNHAAQVATSLLGTVPDVRVVAFRELPEHGDLTDWVELGGTREALEARAAQAPKWSPLVSACYDAIELENLSWIWPGRFALKKFAILAGLPDEGKGQVIADIIARVTTGAPWPCGEGAALQGNVVMLSAEDDDSDTIKPRLLAAGADLKRVHALKLMKDGNGERMFSLVTDLEPLRYKINEIGGVRLAVIDPISAYLGVGKVDSFRATDVRAIAGPLSVLATDLEVSVIGIMHFNKKSDVMNVMLRISDSAAWPAAARHVYAVVDDAESERKLLIKGKNNLAPRDQQTLAFTFAEREVGVDRHGVAVRAPHITWAPEPVDITAMEAMQAAAAGGSSPRNEAKRFLCALFADSKEPIAAAQILEAARENGVATNTLRRAAKDLDFEITKDGPPSKDGQPTWQWRMPRG